MATTKRVKEPEDKANLTRSIGRGVPKWDQRGYAGVVSGSTLRNYYTDGECIPQAETKKKPVD
jgi:hypothetical protein